MNLSPRDHGGGLDAAIALYGGTRDEWIDLSTGINPQPYPIGPLPHPDWTRLPDQAAFAALDAAARRFWNVPQDAAVLAAPGASSLIARLPALKTPGKVHIPAPTYNEHAAAFTAQGWELSESSAADAEVFVHPNNPDGRLWTARDMHQRLTIIDESFCDIMPANSLLSQVPLTNTVILKSFGKFWGLAGMRLGFAIGDPALINRLRDFIGPWAVSGPALSIGTNALSDIEWAQATRIRLAQEAQRLDRLVTVHGASCIGGTDLFRLYHVNSAQDWQNRLAQHHIWSRIFPYSDHWLRLGLPPAQGWSRLDTALQT